jgi:hypothetical protein
MGKPFGSKVLSKAPGSGWELATLLLTTLLLIYHLSFTHMLFVCFCCCRSFGVQDWIGKPQEQTERRVSSEPPTKKQRISASVADVAVTSTEKVRKGTPFSYHP